VKLSLDHLTNVATLLTCVAILFLFVQRSQRESIIAPPTFEVGETIRDLPAVSFGSASRTLLLVASEDCRYCQESVPFYKTMAKQVADVDPLFSLQLLVVTADSQEESERFLISSGLDTAKIIRLAPDEMRALKVPGTPTLVLADHRGKVIGVWVGKLNTDREREVLAALAGKE
jgi:thioredoxin-related protein